MLKRLGIEKSGYDWGIQKCRSYRWKFLGFEFELHLLEFQQERKTTFIISRKKKSPDA